MPYVIYLPTGYDQSRSRYPVVYLLHGAGGDENARSQNGHIRDHFDRLVAAGTLPPTMLVMPGCPGCWWVDGARDKGETAFWQDLVPELSRRYRTIEGRDGRVVIGLSAGGYGAIRFGLNYPDRVCAVAALSPAIYATSPPPASAARSQPPFRLPDGTFDPILVRRCLRRTWPDPIGALALINCACRGRCSEASRKAGNRKAGNRKPETGTSGLMSRDRKRSDGQSVKATAPIFNSTNFCRSATGWP